MSALSRNLVSVFKLRIGVAIMLCALAGVAVTPGAGLDLAQMLVLALAVLLSSAAAGAFNQYAERSLDARMGRTRKRPFVTGELTADLRWPVVIVALTVISVAGAGMTDVQVAFIFDHDVFRGQRCGQQALNLGDAVRRVHQGNTWRYGITCTSSYTPASR